jgi:hypothetical protein
MTNSAIAVNKLRKSFKAQTVLDGVVAPAWCAAILAAFRALSVWAYKRRMR